MVDFLVREDFYLFIWKFAKISKQLIIPIKSMISCKPHKPVRRQLMNFFIVFIKILLVKFSGKNYETSYFYTLEKVFEYFDRKITVIDQTGACDEIKSVNKVLWNFWAYNSENTLLNIFVDVFLFGTD